MLYQKPFSLLYNSLDGFVLAVEYVEQVAVSTRFCSTQSCITQHDAGNRHPCLSAVFPGCVALSVGMTVLASTSRSDRLFSGSHIPFEACIFDQANTFN